MDEVTRSILAPENSDMPAAYKYVDYALKPVWETYYKQLGDEYAQCLDEGLDVEKLKGAFEAVKSLEDGAFKALAADRLFEKINALPVKADYPFDEPNDIEQILSKRPAGEKTKRAYDKAKIKDRIAGAWYGRICGCLLGKPVEGMRSDELVPFLKQSGNYPMRRYIVSGDVTDEVQARFRFRFRQGCCADGLACAPVDDDTNYTCLYQQLINRYGRDFTSDDVCAIWMSRQPKTAYCTAERVAFMNMANGLTPPFTAVYQNPYREWIGAQIRADYFGYINPGDPETAARMAWRDARVSHVKNGIYGEMLLAAMIAAAAAESDIPSIIRAGLGQIPENCRLQKRVRELLDAFFAGTDEEAAFGRIGELYDEHTGYGWCHTIPNALIVCASLLYSGGDFTRAVGRAVQSGFDTDCNGASVGSVLGMRGGTGCMDENWLLPLNGTLDTTITGVGRVKIDALAENTLAHLI